MKQVRDGGLDGGSLPLTVALIACFSVGQLGANLAPFLLEALEEHGAMSASRASYLMSAEFGGLLAATLAFWRWGTRWSVSAMARFGMLAYAIGALATALSSDAISIGAARALCGIGSGAAMAAANAAAASQTSFDTLISRSIAGSTLVAFVLYVIVPAIREWQGPGALFLTLGVCGAVFFIPAGYLSRGDRVTSDASPRSHAQPTAVVKPRGWVMASAVLLMGAAFFARINDSLSWTFNARYADKAHVDAQLLGLILGLLTLACVLAPFASSALSRRFGYLTTFLGVVIVKLIASAGLYFATSLPMFVLCQAAMFFTFVITMQLLASALAAADGSGRLPTIGILPLLAADFLGPSLAGISFAGAGLAGVTIAACIAALSATPLLLAAMAFGRGTAVAAVAVSSANSDASAATSSHVP